MMKQIDDGIGKTDFAFDKESSNPFQKAKKGSAKLRLALTGPAGSGKTYTALEIARFFPGRTALIDTEHKSSEKYAEEFDFDVLALTTFSPEHYIDAIHAAEENGYANIIIDSLSHAWNGIDGVLQMVDEKTKASRSQNSYIAWGDVTPVQNRMIEAILGSKCNMFVTMRTKTEYALENVNGKQVPKKLGLAPVQRDGVEYEFDVILDLTIDNDAVISKTRCSALKNKVLHHPGKQVADILMAWLGSGAPIDEAEKKQKEFVAKKVAEGLPQSREAAERTAKIIDTVPDHLKPEPKEELVPEAESVEELSLVERILRCEAYLTESKVADFLTPKKKFAFRKKNIGVTIFDGLSDKPLEEYLALIAGIAEERANN